MTMLPWYCSRRNFWAAAKPAAPPLIWVYYNAQIVLAGAEFTRVYAEHHGSKKPACAVGPC
jgi:membrane protein